MLRCASSPTNAARRCPPERASENGFVMLCSLAYPNRPYMTFLFPRSLEKTRARSFDEKVTDGEIRPVLTHTFADFLPTVGHPPATNLRSVPVFV